MRWSISLSRQADKFLTQCHLPDEFVAEAVERALQRFAGKPIAVDLRRLTGKWAGHFRIRIGKVRIIFSLDLPTHRVLVEIVDNRDRSYR